MRNLIIGDVFFEEKQKPYIDERAMIEVVNYDEENEMLGIVCSVREIKVVLRFGFIDFLRAALKLEKGEKK